MRSKQKRVADRMAPQGVPSVIGWKIIAVSYGAILIGYFLIYLMSFFL
jgi:hypothetical protein